MTKKMKELYTTSDMIVRVKITRLEWLKERTKQTVAIKTFHTKLIR
jgi:hypothetical protein